MIKKIGIYIMLAIGGLILQSSTLHKYYVSISEMEFNVDEKRYEISVKFIGHDLEHALEKAGVPKLELGSEQEHEEADEYLFKYLTKKFKLSNGENDIELEFVGKEVGNDDFIHVYVQSKPVANVAEIEIYNSLLTEIFDDQVNIMYYKSGDKTRTYRFTKTKVKTVM